MHQVLKAVEGLKHSTTDSAGTLQQRVSPEAVASRLSQYCPARLFSGHTHTHGIAHAVYSLAASPQNNFRVFVDGKHAFSHESVAPDRCSFEQLQAALESHGSVHASTRWLGSRDVLESIASDKLSVELMELAKRRPLAAGLCTLVSHALQASGALPALQRAAALDSYGASFVANLLRRALPSGTVLEESNVHQAVASLDDSAANLVRDYMIAATAKDASLMVTIRPFASEPASDTLHSLHPPVQTFRIGSTQYVFTCTIVDLDPKPVARIPHYEQLEQDLVRTFSMDNIGERAFQVAGRRCGLLDES